MVTVEYHVAQESRAAFLQGLDHLSHARRRDGAYEWALYEDAERAARILETFYLESWAEYLRQHERVTNFDRELQQAIRKLTQDEPRVNETAEQLEQLRDLGCDQFQGFSAVRRCSPAKSRNSLHCVLRSRQFWIHPSSWKPEAN